MADHSACLQEVRMVVRKRSVLLAEESLAKNFMGGAGPSRTSTVTCKKYCEMADSAAVHGTWYGTGCAVMARCHLPEICPKSPIPP